MPQALERFEQAPERPPDKVIEQLFGASTTAWRSSQVGYAGHFPNGGIWRYTDETDGSPEIVVKRLGAQFLGRNRVWCGSLDPQHPHWWQREAEFYRSSLAANGWGAQARPARCYAVAPGPSQTIELWLEALEIPSRSFDTYEKAVASLASWQLATANTTAGCLTTDWIPSHLARHGLDNAATIAHPNWQHAIERGLDPRVRHAVSNRVTDPKAAARRLAALPQVLNHYDFHNCNIGRRPDGEVRVIDWAYAGWGPIGQDVGHLALDTAHWLGSSIQATWGRYLATYLDALRAAGWTGQDGEVRQSTATSTAIRHGWAIDELLNNATTLPDERWPAAAEHVEFVADLILRLPRN